LTIEPEAELPIQALQIPAAQGRNEQVLQPKQARLTPILGQGHGPHDAKVMHIAALTRVRMPKAISHHVHHKRAMHVSTEPGVIHPIGGVHPQRLKDAVDAERRMVLQEQIPLAIEQHDIEVAREAWPWHPFWGLDGEERAVIIRNMQLSDGRTFLTKRPQRKLA